MAIRHILVEQALTAKHTDNYIHHPYHLAVRLLDLLIRGGARHTKRCVQVLGPQDVAHLGLLLRRPLHSERAVRALLGRGAQGQGLWEQAGCGSLAASERCVHCWGVGRRGCGAEGLWCCGSRPDVAHSRRACTAGVWGAGAVVLVLGPGCVV